MQHRRPQLQFLGAVALVRSDGEAIPISGASAAGLLAYLATNPARTRTREELVALLWPDDDEQTGRQRLRQTIYSLRQQLAEVYDGAAALIVANRTSIGLSPERITTDVQEFVAAVTRAENGVSPEERTLLLERAVALYKGDFAPGVYLDPVIGERNLLSESYLKALQSLTHAYEQSGRTDEAIACAQRTIAVNPLLEEAYCDLMRLHSASGKPSAVLRQYQDLERTLRAELGEEPSERTRALMQSLRDSGMDQVARRPQHVRTASETAARSQVEPSLALRASGLPIRAILAVLAVVAGLAIFRSIVRPPSTPSTPTPATLWERRIPLEPGDSGSEPTAMTMGVASDAPIITGFVRTAAHDVDFVTLAYSREGKQLWEQRYNGPGNDLDRARSVSTGGQDGSVFVTGESDNGKGNEKTRLCGLDFATVKYAPDGRPAPSWPDVGFGVGVRRYNGPGDGEDWPVKVVGMPDGGCIVSGRSWDGTNRDGSPAFAAVILRYGPSGETIWVHRERPPDALYCAFCDMTYGVGGVVAALRTCRRTQTGLETTDSIASYDLAGKRVWQRDISTCPGLESHESRIFQSGQMIYVAATSHNFAKSDNGAGLDMLAAKLDPDGNIKWLRTYDGPAHLDDVSEAVTAGAGGSLIVAGQSYAAPNTLGLALAQYGPDGSTMWTTRSTGTGEPAVIPQAICPVVDGVYVSGILSRSLAFNDFATSSYDYVTLKYDAGGNLVWRATYDGPAASRDRALAIATNSRGELFVTGQSADSKARSILTFRYSPNAKTP